MLLAGWVQRSAAGSASSVLGSGPLREVFPSEPTSDEGEVERDLGEWR